MPTKTLQVLDYIVFLLYFGIVAGFALRMSVGQKTTSKYFVADRTVPTWVVAFTLMATMISSGSVVGHPGTVFDKGLILLLGNLTILPVLVLVALYIVPFYRKVIGVSAYEYLNIRFGPGARFYSSLGFMGDRIFDLGVTQITTAVAIHVMTGWSIFWVVVWVSAFTTLYTCIGGIEGVVWTSAIQGIILVGGAVSILLYLLFAPEAGPPFAVVQEAWRGGKFNMGSFDLSWDSLYSAETTQWLFMLAYLINFSRRYITDQHMVQRYLLARTDADASRGALWGAISCVPIWVTFMLIGSFLYGYYQLVDSRPADLPDHIVPYFIVQTFPQGVVGLFLAAILSASMSSVSADLNSVSAVLTTDYFGTWFPKSADRVRLLFGQAMVLVAGAAATVIAVYLIPKEGVKPVMERVIDLVAILSGGVVGLFALGFLTRRATREGCYAGIIACLLFTLWGTLTAVLGLDFGFNFTMKPIMIGILGHFVLFGVGYAVSVLHKGYRPQDIESLTFHGYRRRRSSI